MVYFVATLLTILPTIVISLNRDDPCNTPNGERATCKAVFACKPIAEGIISKEKTAIQFAKESQCGYDTEPLVCCGSTGTYVTDIFTRTPTTTVASTTTTTTITTTTSQVSSTSQKTPVFQSTTSNTHLPDRSICGLKRDDERIVGGERTAIDEFPWMALLAYNFTDGTDAGFRCGGTIINNRYVLTAAHCIRTTQQNLTIVKVRLGEWDVTSDPDCIDDEVNLECADPVVDVTIDELIPHAYYNWLTGNNDIALIRLSRDIEYTDFIRPICLPPAEFPAPPPDTLMTACGWGRTENSSFSEVKLKVDLPLITNAECAKKLNDRRTRISANQVCAGGVSLKDSCQGDSGGPLMRPYADNISSETQWYQEGVVSRGRGCGRTGFPGIYTRVARYINWLTNNLKN